MTTWEGLQQKVNTAQRLVGRPLSAAETDAIRHDSFDAKVYRDLLDEAPALHAMVYEDLGQKYDYTEDLARDVLMEFWQSNPLLRGGKEMDPRFLLNHAVSREMLAAPETPETRAYTKHDKYGAAMATIAVTSKIKDLLDNAKEAQEKAEEAAKREEEFKQAIKDLLQAMLDAGMKIEPGDGEGGDEDGEGEGVGTGMSIVIGVGSGPLSEEGQEGPLTQAQQEMIDNLEAAIEEAQGKEISYEETLAEAQEQAEGVRRQATQPVREAIKEVGDMLAEEAELMAAWGIEDGVLQLMSFADRRRLAEALRRNRMNQFRKLIGRFRIMAAAQRSKKVEYARDEAYTVEMSDRIPDVLATEMANLANKHTRLDFLNRLSEGQLISKKYRGIEKIGQGAIIALVDNSGSMSASVDRTGVTREAFAKAFALSLLDQAREANRDFVGINFSSRNQISIFEFPKGQGDIYEVMRFIEEFYGGGTDFEAPVDRGVEILEKQFNQAGLIRGDIVFITDDDCRVSPQWMHSFIERRERLGFRCFGIAVGIGAGNALGAICDGNVRSVLEFSDPSAVADIFRVI